MRTLITGGCGFIGQRLALGLLDRKSVKVRGFDSAIGQITLADTVLPASLSAGLAGNVDVLECDLCSADLAESAKRSDLVFHLAAVPSGGCESDFAKAMRVNLDGTRLLLETLRDSGKGQRMVFSSTLAVFGTLPDGQRRVSDTTKHVPLTTYGMTKAACELLVNDFARKGYVDGRSARLSTVVIRAGKPNSAASSFCSGVIREPLLGEDAQLPVPRSQQMLITSYNAVVEGMIKLAEVEAGLLGADRAVGLPARCVSAGDLVDCSTRLARSRVGMGQVEEAIDPTVARICASWPTEIDDCRARELGMPMPPELDAIVAEFINDFVDTT